MKKTRRTTEQIIRILRDAEGEQLKTGEVCRKYSISPETEICPYVLDESVTGMPTWVC